MSVEREQSKRAVIAATVVAMTLSFAAGLLSTGLVSALCGTDPSEGSYCQRISEGKFPIEELCLILVPVLFAALLGVLSVRRGSARPLRLGSFPLLLTVMLLPFIVGVAWK